MPTPTEGIDDEARHKSTDTDAAQEADEVNPHPDSTFVKEENICLNSGAKTFAGRVREGTDYPGGFQAAP